jgi:hypothetical protein
VNRILRGLAAATVLVLTVPACNNTPNDRFFKDAAAHGVPTNKTMVTNGLQQNMGEAACSHVKDSKDPGAAVTYLVKLAAGFTENEAMVTTYWAAKDLCPDQIGLFNDSWKDAVNNPNPSG